ncbi:hypothetical protein ACWOEH_06785 [Enterococcus nangangensis]
MKRLTKIAATLPLLFSLALALLQLVYLYVQHALALHYIWDGLFYLMNILIILLALLGILPFIHKKLLASLLAGVLLVLQVVLFFFGTASTTITSTSPDGENIFILQQSKATGELTYQRSVYYEWPQLQTKLGTPSSKNYYWFLAKDAEYLTYPAKKGKVFWLTPDVAVFNYQTPDGSHEQFMRGYQDFAASNMSTFAPLIGTWSAADGTTLQGGGATYPLTVAGNTYTLDPTYAKVYSDQMIVFHETNGNAICALVVKDDSTLSLLMTDGQDYLLTKN